MEPVSLIPAAFVRDDEKMIQDYYGSRGYADARVDTSILECRPGPGHGRLPHHRRHEVLHQPQSTSPATPSRRTKVIRRELPFRPGEELNTVKIAAGKSRLENLNYFSAVDVRTTPTISEGYKDMDISVAEQSTGTVNFGAGFSSIDSITAFVGVTQTNFDIRDWKDFRGGGQRFNANARAGSLRRDFSVTWTEPWFMGQPLALTVEPSIDNLFYLSNRFDQTNVGASVGLRKRMASTPTGKVPTRSSRSPSTTSPAVRPEPSSRQEGWHLYAEQDRWSLGA
jgi:outer membrane protein insertion porin family